MKTRVIRVIPRMIAWVVVLLGVAWFVHVSPKTPLEFFDAANDDSDAIERRKLQEYEKIDPAAAAEFRKREGNLSFIRQMHRIALIHDLTNDAAYVQEERPWIVEGSYYPGEKTDETLKARDERYRALAKKLEERRAAADKLDEERAESEADKALAARLDDVRETAERNGLSHTLSRMGIDRLILRWFQARLFWRKRI